MPPEPAANPPATPVTRGDLMRWLWPHCEQQCLALLYPKSDGGMQPAWIQDAADARRALDAFSANRLEDERFECVNKRGTRYSVAGAQRLGLVPHRDGVVSAFCVDLDDHTGDGGNVSLFDPVVRFFGAEPVVFTSKGGKGLHAFFELGNPMPIASFVVWSRSWRFNRTQEGRPELIPKTHRKSQVWMPGEPNGLGGDAYRSGRSASAVISALPPAVPVAFADTVFPLLFDPPPEGARNEAFNKVAFELGVQRADRHAAWTLCQWWRDRCDFPHKECRDTFERSYAEGLAKQRGAGSTPQASPGDYELDGIGHGERFARMHRSSARYCVQEQAWYTFETTRWLRSDIKPQAMAKQTARAIPDPSARRRASTKTGVKEILYLAASEPGMAVDAAAFDGDPMLFNCRSGTVDLRTGQLRTHDPSDLLRKVSPVPYEPGGGCPHWLAFLGTVTGGDTELIGYLQRVCGYLLTGHVSEQCLFFLFGDGCNGKSVFCSAVQHILGDYAVRVPAELVMKPPRGLGSGPTPDAVRLLGARLAVASELEDGHTLGESRVKDLTGGDRMVARPLYAQPVEFDPTHKLLLYGNHKPEIRGVDHGIWRRIRLVPFTVTIPQARRDPQLLDKLRAEAGAILAWMVEGCLAWQRDGLGLPEAVWRATGAFQSESDQVGRFVEECCVRADGVETPKSAVYERYRAWCEASGERVLSGKALSPRMIAHGFIDGRKKSGRTWIGVAIGEDTP